MKRSIFLLLAILCFFPLLSVSQSEDADPYSVRLVRMATHSHFKGVIIAKVQTHIARMGDQVSIALLKDLSDADLVDPQKVEEFLPVIRDCFSQPQQIELDIDKKPRITLFLLRYVRQAVHDPQVQRDLDETIRFVIDKTEK
jgi:hypothetical protein